MKFRYDDGGAQTAGYKGEAGDCVVRSFAIASGEGYENVRQLLLSLTKEEKITKRNPKRSTPRGGVSKETTRRLAEALGYQWVPLMQVGQGCKYHLSAGELPVTKYPMVVKVTRHVTVVENGDCIVDTYDCSRDGTRCVYGLYVHAEDYAATVNTIAGIDTGLDQSREMSLSV